MTVVRSGKEQDIKVTLGRLEDGEKQASLDAGANGKGPAAPIFDVPLSAHKITGYAWSHVGKVIAITSHWSAPYVEWTSGPTSNKEFR